MRTVIAIFATTALLTTSIFAANAPLPSTAPSPLAASMPAVPPVLKHIPSDSFGFLLINDVKGTAGSVDTFMNKIGVSGFVRDRMPKGLLAFIKQELKLGDDFTGEGPAALVVHNFAVTGITFEEYGDMESKVPVVFIIPGKSFKAVFPKAETSSEGDLIYFNIEDAKGQAIEKNGLIFMATNEASLRAAVDCANSVASTLSKEQIQLVERSNLSAFVNVKAIRPAVMGMLEAKIAEAKQEELPGSITAGLETAMSMLKSVLESFDGLMAGARLTADNVAVEALLDAAPNSEMAKQFAALKPAPVLDKLPAGPYVIAAASSVPGQYGIYSKTAGGSFDMVDAMVKAHLEDANSPFTEETVKKLVELAKLADKNYRGYQFAVYGPQKDRAVSAAFVIDFVNIKEFRKSAQELLSKMLEETGAASEIPFDITTQPAGEGVESISIKPKDEDDADFKKAKDVMKPIIGDELRLLMATPDDRTLVLTFGGGKEFMDDVLKAVKDGGDLGKDANILKAMKQLPGKPVEFALVNGGNLVDTITKIIELTGGSPTPLAVTQTPLITGTSVSGNTMHTTIIVPNLLIKQSVSSAIMLFMGAGGMKALDF